MSVREERHGRIAVVTIDRPEVRNAIDPATAQELDTVFDALQNADDVWAVVLTGAGDSAFCAGLDLKALAAEGPEGLRTRHGFAGLTQRQFPKPLVAAVNGAALAGGFELVLACDLVVAADTAVFGLPEVRRGIMAGAGGLVRLPKRVPIAVALELVMTGAPIPAERARELGLANRVVAPQQVRDEALGLAEQVAANAPLAVRWSKALAYEALDLPESDAWARNDEYTDRIVATEDYVEGPRAFAEGREPRWTGRERDVP